MAESATGDVTVEMLAVIMHRRMTQQERRSALLLLAATLFILVMNLSGIIFPSYELILVLLGLGALALASSFIMGYRIKRGWYGNCEADARDLIDFMIANSSTHESAADSKDDQSTSV
ncbi:hypothetical protein HGA91_00075 [candidate division WWE3 bacterium]|nr:hypothetical protein [candidate division WWE3 bacterium]